MRQRMAAVGQRSRRQPACVGTIGYTDSRGTREKEKDKTRIARLSSASRDLTLLRGK